jgi:hypothetical protein
MKNAEDAEMVGGTRNNMRGEEADINLRRNMMTGGTARMLREETEIVIGNGNANAIETVNESEREKGSAIVRGRGNVIGRETAREIVTLTSNTGGRKEAHPEIADNRLEVMTVIKTAERIGALVMNREREMPRLMKKKRRGRTKIGRTIADKIVVMNETREIKLEKKIRKNNLIFLQPNVALT